MCEFGLSNAIIFTVICILTTGVLSEDSKECKTGKCYTTKECNLNNGNIEFKSCIMTDGVNGSCCSIDETITLSEGLDPLETEEKPDSLSGKTSGISVMSVSSSDGKEKVPEVSSSDIIKAINANAKDATQYVTDYGFRVPTSSGGSPDTVALSKNGLIGLEIAKKLVKTFKWNRAQYQNFFARIDLKGSVLSNICPKEIKCSDSEIKSVYRSADGSCNNLNTWGQSWGQTFTVYNRLTITDYADGLDAPRVASNGNQLPSARLVSTTLATDINEVNPDYTLLVMSFGQFLDHDLTQTLITKVDANTISCCNSTTGKKLPNQHQACLPIDIPKNDAYFSQLLIKPQCMELVRAAAGLRSDCIIGPRLQLNQLTAYIDGGMIYGSTLEKSKNLRSLVGGRLKTSAVPTSDKRQFLPFVNESIGCSKSLKAECSFFGGDTRANENTPLTTMHTIFLREHNRIADKLKVLNPQWNDEILYQESRRIVIAELQLIVYTEFLPVLIGRDTMNRFGLILNRNGCHYRYSPFTNPSIISEFSNAAYRFHTLVPGLFDMRSNDNRVLSQLKLRENFNNPLVLSQSGSIDKLVNGLSGQGMQKVDNYFTSDLTNHLYEQTSSKPSLLDLVALNTQRARDTGIPSYNAIRTRLGLGRVNSFKDLRNIFIDPSIADKMSGLYENVDDIDLFIAAVSEKHLVGANVGPTFASIIAEQFRRIKEGDRFWFENQGMRHSFTPNQLKEIWKTSLARILCDNSDVPVMQPLAFVQETVKKIWNPKVSCAGLGIPRLDLNAWKTK